MKCTKVDASGCRQIGVGSPKYIIIFRIRDGGIPSMVYFIRSWHLWYDIMQNNGVERIFIEDIADYMFSSNPGNNRIISTALE